MNLQSVAQKAIKDSDHRSAVTGNSSTRVPTRRPWLHGWPRYRRFARRQNRHWQATSPARHSLKSRRAPHDRSGRGQGEDARRGRSRGKEAPLRRSGPSPHVRLRWELSSGRITGRVMGLRSCRRGDLNPHALAGTSPSSWRVCLFRHSDEHAMGKQRPEIVARAHRPLSGPLVPLTRGRSVVPA
jgi:hypothetical protein